MRCTAAKPKFEIRRLGDARLNHGRQQRIFRLDFQAIKIFEAAQFQAGRSQMLEVYKRLLHKSVGHVSMIVVGRIVGPAQSELALRSRHHRVVWQAENRRLFAFHKPINVFPGLPNAHAQRGIPQAIVAVSSCPSNQFQPSARVRQLTEISRGPSLCLAGAGAVA